MFEEVKSVKITAKTFILNLFKNDTMPPFVNVIF